MGVCLVSYAAHVPALHLQILHVELKVPQSVSKTRKTAF